jgi:IclR family transcriptional regulator, acetate operon repressor
MSSGKEAWHVVRTLRSLELLALRPRSAPELADALGVHVRTARRILKRLEGEGYVALGSDRRRRSRSTMRVVALAGQVVERAELTRVALPYVTSLQAALGEDCHLCVPTHLRALCLVHVSREGSAECRPQLRELVPCHCTASGKALLAWRDAWRDAVLEQPLRSFTDRTLTGPEWLRRELGRTRSRGFAVEDREYQVTTRGLAVPVFDGEQAVAAPGVVAPADRLSPGRGKGLVIGPLKSRHSQRDLPIPIPVADRLTTHVRGRAPGGLVFANKARTMLDPDNLAERVLCTRVRGGRRRVGGLSHVPAYGGIEIVRAGSKCRAGAALAWPPLA